MEILTKWPLNQYFTVALTLGISIILRYVSREWGGVYVLLQRANHPYNDDVKSDQNVDASHSTFNDIGRDQNTYTINMEAAPSLGKHVVRSLCRRP
jgi:hypothetical protein